VELQLHDYIIVKQLTFYVCVYMPYTCKAQI